MPAASAKRSFDKGLAALADGRPLEAADSFLDAMQTQERLRVRRPDMRYLSYYGLSLARAHRALHAATEACSLALGHDPDSRVLLLNLGRVHMMAGRRSAALGCFERGLELAPHHRALARELARANRRASAPLTFLDRGHALNRWTGQARTWVAKRMATNEPLPAQNMD